MNKKQFTNDSRVVKSVEAIKKISSKKRFSDVLDSKGNQYVDLVMEGGGVLGLALVGYTYGLEQAGIRFRSTAGTSAGAINALFIQAMGTPDQKRSDKMINLVASMPMADFQDGGNDGTNAVDAWRSGGFSKWMHSFRVIDDIVFRLGLNPGDEFHQWVTKKLESRQVATWAQLKKQMQTKIPGLGIYDESNQLEKQITLSDWNPELKLVTAELSTTTKMILPEQDGELVYHDLNKANPADFARASMSVPIFFEPFRISGLPRSQYISREWEKRGQKETPDELVFVDGGVISNFPISSFHRPTGKPPRMPTFGAKLGLDGSPAKKIDDIKDLFFSTISIMRSDADEEFIHKNPDYRYLVKEIPTGKHDWLNFDMDPKDKVDLFAKGVRSAKEFLNSFDWERYKEMRGELAKL